MLQEAEVSRAFRTTATGLFLISTWNGGKPNVQFAFRALGIQEKDPPLLLIGVIKTNYSLQAIEQSGEFVLNACSSAQVSAIKGSMGVSGRDVDDKFGLLGLEPLPSKYVKAPRVAGCHANVECRVLDSMQAGGELLFLAEALACYVDDENPPVVRYRGKTWSLGELLD